MIQVGNTLTTSKKDTLVALLIEFKEVIAWPYEDMLGIDTNSNRSNHEANQAEVEKDEARVDPQDQKGD